MRTSVKRVVAAVIAGVAASMVIASPALAVKPVQNDQPGFRQIELWSDNGDILAGYVRVTKLSDNWYDVWACDRNVDGRYIVARVDVGHGFSFDYGSTGAENGCSFTKMDVTRFKLGWATASGIVYLTPKWYTPLS